MESTQQEQLSLQRKVADDLEGVLEGFDGIKDRLTIMSSLFMALTRLSLAGQGGTESSESSGRSEQPLQAEDAGNVSQPESPHEQPQG